MQLPCNAPNVLVQRNSPVPAPNIVVANYQRAGTASFISQGSRPNYQSSFNSLNFAGPRDAIDSQIRNTKRHQKYFGSAYRDLSLPGGLTDGEILIQLLSHGKIC